MADLAQLNVTTKTSTSLGVMMADRSSAVRSRLELMVDWRESDEASRGGGRRWWEDFWGVPQPRSRCIMSQLFGGQGRGPDWCQYATGYGELVLSCSAVRQAALDAMAGEEGGRKQKTSFLLIGDTSSAFNMAASLCEKNDEINLTLCKGAAPR